MKNLKKFAGVTLVALIMSLGFFSFAGAQEFRTGDHVNISDSEKINGALFVSGKTLDISSDVNGDIFCIGQNISISGMVKGDVICAGQTVSIKGQVEGDVRVAGQTLNISGKVDGSATIAGQTMNLESTGVVGRDVVLGSADASLNGSIGRDLVVGGSNINISGEVGRNITGEVSDLILASGAVVQGKLDYKSANEAEINDSAEVVGEITRTEPDKSEGSKNGAVFGFAAGWFVYWLLAMLFSAMALVLLFPQVFSRVSENGINKPLKAVLVGFVAGLVAPALIILSVITVVGIPFAILLLFLWIVLVMLSGPVFGYYLGRKILGNNENALMVMLIGVVVLTVFLFIPIIGFLAAMIALWMGIGMQLIELFQRTPKPVYVDGKSSGGSKKTKDSENDKIN